MVKRLLLILLPVLVLLVGFLSARYMLDTQREVTPAEDPAMEAGAPGDVATVAVVLAQSVSAAPELTLYGQVLPERRLEKVAPRTGEVSTLMVAAGDAVAAGDTLLTLSTRDSERQLAQLAERERDLAAEERQEQRQQAAAEEALQIEQELTAIAERSVSRVRDLQQRNLSSASDLEEAERNLQTQRLSVNQQRLEVEGHEDRLERLAVRRAELELDIEQLQDEIDDATVTAPFSGEVVDLQVEAGSSVSAQNPILTLIDRSRLRIEAQLPVHQAPLLTQGMAATLTTDSDDLAVTLRSWEPVSRSGSLRLRFDTTDDALPAAIDAFYPLRLVLPERDEVFPLPLAALYESRHVYRVVDSQLERVSVDIEGYRGRGEQAEALVRSDDLNSGDRLLLTRLANAVTGLPVLVREGDE